MAAPVSNGKPGGIARFLPIVAWLPKYDRAWLRADIIAGLTVWALMVPTSMGYATISGVPVQYGLYAAAAGLIAFAMLTTSRQVTQGPSSSTAAVLGAAVLGVASAGSDDAIAMASSIVLVAGDRTIEIDARPSDALALAIRCDARILIDDAVMESAGISMVDEINIEQTESDTMFPGAAAESVSPEAAVGPDLGVFRDFINSLDLDDFDKGTKG